MTAGPLAEADPGKTLVAPSDRSPHSTPEARVFVGAKGATPRRANFATVWSRARQAVGRPDLHLHDLRHYANLTAASAGASTRELMSRLGHASAAAAPRYQHATAERDQLIAERMEELISGSRVTPRVTAAPLDLIGGGQQAFYLRLLVERVTGIEPAWPAWKAGTLTIELHPQRRRGY